MFSVKTILLVTYPTLKPAGIITDPANGKGKESNLLCNRQKEPESLHIELPLLPNAAVRRSAASPADITGHRHSCVEGGGRRMGGAALQQSHHGIGLR